MKISDTKNSVIKKVQKWIESSVIAHNFCPFAKRVIEQEMAHYLVIDSNQLETEHLEKILHLLIDACVELESNSNIETTLLIFANSLGNFDDFLDALEVAQQLLEKQGYSGIYQIANFHPNYQFEGTEPNDNENITNQSPYPIWQILRESSIEKVSQHYDLDSIPERNIEYCRTQLGNKKT